MHGNTSKADRNRSALDQRTTYRFSILAARQTRCLAEMYSQKFDLTVSQWKILAIIGYYAPMSAKEVSERTSLEPEKVTRAVDRLVARSLVVRRPDPADRRRVILSLAAKGKEIFLESERIRTTIEDEFLSVLQPKEQTSFRAILNKLDHHSLELFGKKQAWQKIVKTVNSRAKPGS